MKLRSLFLASLAAMAMVSCSNEDDQIIDNGGNVEKNAVMQLGISFPNTVTRAATSDGTDEGTKSEQNINNISVVLVYEDGFKQLENFSANKSGDFTIDGKKVITKEFSAIPGSATAYVYINPTEDITVSNYETVTATAEDALDGILKGAAQESNFYMTGISSKTEIKINTLNSIDANVSRIAAKLVESTNPETKYEIKDKKDNTAVIGSVNILEYTYANLNKSVLALNLTQTINSWFQACTFDKNNQFTYPTVDTNKKATNEEGTITYCLENNSETNATTIVYKAKVNIDGVAEGANFYIYKNVIYKTFNDLDDEFNKGLTQLGLSDSSTYSEFSKQGIEKYTGGICYYAAKIETAGTPSVASIVRNNWYKLSVNTVKNIGSPVPDGEDPLDPTLLKLNITVKDWAVNLNKFDL